MNAEGNREKKGTGPICRNGPEGAAHKLDLSPFSHRMFQLLSAEADGWLEADGRRELLELLRRDPRARAAYAEQAILHSLLFYKARCGEGRGAKDEGRGMAGSPAIDLPVGAAVEHPVGAAVKLPSGQWPQTPDPESRTPSLPTTHYPLPTSDFVGSWAFSYMVATVIMGVAILGFWAYKITHHQHIAEAPSQSAPSKAMQEMVFVGRITGMVDVKWSDDPRYLPPPGFAHVPLGREYRLDAGLLEITYDSGAKVILEGPCTYEVESTAGGYLALGKLTARIEERREKREERSQTADSTSSLIPHPSSFILHPSSLFSVRTPTALITDLGTEFGVEVSEEGTTTSHVFRGSVKVQVVAGGNGEGVREVILGENESARVEMAEDRLIVVRGSADAAGFVRPGQLAQVARQRRLAPLRHWQAFGEELRKRGDLLAHYDFQPNEKDLSVLRNRAATGAALDGRIEGAEWVYGRLPGKSALYFHGPGSGDKVALPEPERFNFTGPFSVAVWFKVYRFTGMWQALIAKGNTSWRLQQARETNLLQFGTNYDQDGEPSCHDLIGRTEVADGRWHLAVAVYEPAGRVAQKRLYLDGCLESESEVPLPLHQNDEPVWLGANADKMWTNRGLNGAIDETTIFARALSNDEVAAMFDAGSGAKRVERDSPHPTPSTTRKKS